MLTIWEKIKAEITQGYSLRTSLISEISEYFENRYVVSLYTRFRTGDSITDDDFEMLKTLLSGSKEISGKKIIFIIHSPGGDPLAAEKIIKLLSEYSDNDYWVLIPGTAKSAATMICFGSSEIILSSMSELGPIDLQISRGNSLMPTSSIITAYDNLMNTGINLNNEQQIEPILQQLQAFDPSEIEYFKQVNDLATDISKKVLKNCMMKDIDLTEIENTIKLFTDPKESKIHGRPIFYSDIANADEKKHFNMRCIDINNKVWEIISEYHLRAIHNLRANNAGKLIESSENSLIAISNNQL
jgi:hypothetical protein